MAASDLARPDLDASRLLDSLDDAVIAFDAEDSIVGWNAAAERLFGIEAAAALGASRSVVEPEEDPPGWAAGVRSGGSARFRGRRTDRLGRSHSLDIAASRVMDSEGRTIAVTQVLRPIVAPERRSLIGLAEDMARVGHWRIDLGTDRQFWSDEVYRIHGLDAGTPPPNSQRVLDLYHPEDRGAVATAVRRAIVEGGDIAFEARVVRPGGEVRRVVARGTTERGGDGRATAVVGVIQDRTEQSERDRSLRILREAIEVVPYSIVVYDENDVFVVSNRTFFDLYPYLGDEARLRGKTFEQVLRTSIAHGVVQDGRGAADIDAYVAERLEERRAGKPETERRMSDGHWYLLSRSRTPSGYTISTRIDITGRKQAESELAATTAVLQATLDTMPNALVAFDRDGRLVAWNSAFARLAHVEPADLVRGRTLTGLVRQVVRRSPSAARAIRTLFARIAAREPADFEWRRDDGSAFGVLGRPMADGGYLTLLRDVTTERRAQARAEQYEQRLRNALEAMSEGFALFDPDDVLVMCNETYRRMYGDSSSFIRVGRRLEDMVRDAVAAGQFPAAIGREEEWVAERMRQHRDPPDHPTLQTLSDGRVLMVAEYRTGDGGHVGIRADITERIRIENDLRAARDALEEQARSLRDLAGQIDAARMRAEEAGAAKSRFLAMMSHELRTPMTGLMGMLELLSRTPLDGEQQQFLRTMRGSADTLLALLNDILDYSKLEAGKVQLEEIAFAPAEVVREVIGLFQPQASAKGLQLAASVDASTPTWVRGDPLRVKQILSNLVSNAVKFTAEGGIAVSMRAEPGHKGTVRLLAQVADTGPGIDAEVQQALFQAFEQGDSSTTRRFGGTGLGLAISRRLAEGMGGTIDVDSAPGRGSTFRFDVVVRLAAAPADQPGAHAKDAADAGLRPMRILLAEDNDVNRMLLTKVLAQAGHQVEAVPDGREALRAAVRSTYDVILMDMQMPVMDGLEATRAIRMLPGAAAAVPIVAVTADAMPEHRHIYLDAGVDALLTKPIDWRLLNRTLARIGRSGGRPAPEAAAAPTRRTAPPSAAPQALPVFDQVRVQEGLGVLPPKRVAGMLAMLPAEVHQRLDEYLDAIRREDLQAARRAAHTLKGLAANFGAARLESVSRAAEAACASLPAARAAIPPVEEAVRRTAEAALELSAAFRGRS